MSTGLKGLFCVALLSTALVASQVAAQPSVLGQWDAAHDIGLRVVHAFNIATKDKVMLWGYSLTHSTVVHELDPATFQTEPGTAITSSFCAGNEQLADGRAFIVGGVGQNNESGIYDQFSDEWLKVASMKQMRYYPSATTLADGRVFVTGGSGNKTNTIEIYDPKTNTWDSTSHAPSPVGTGYFYPRVFVLPNAKLGVIHIFGPPQKPLTYDLALKKWTAEGASVVEGGPAAHYLPGKIMMSGHDLREPSRDAASRATRIVDFTTTPVSVRVTAPKAANTQWNNLTMLPDGTVVSFGGRAEGNQPNYTPELWNPVTETWSPLASMKTRIRREYHSIAVLLRDGRVLTGGGEPFLTTAEIFNPPYLYKGSRPTITSAPSFAAYDSTFAVGTAPGAVAKVSLIRLGAVTHANNWGQRFMWLDFTRDPATDVIHVTAPADANLAPPGYYFLFVLNADGIPSVGEYIRVGAQ